jgi:chromosome condensin MukBEF ATPase and DNA-binding subunit MukB
MEDLSRAKEVAEQILAMTRRLVLTGEKEHEASETESYIDLLENREPLIEELTDLKQTMDKSDVASPQFAEIQQIIAQITEHEKTHTRIMQQMHTAAKASYRDIKQGQRIHTGYNPLPGSELSSRFDIKQ